MPRRNINVQALDSDSIPGTPDLGHSDDERPVTGEIESHFPRWMLELEGKKVQNRLELGHVIGRGAFGVVYVGTGTRRRYAGGQSVAVKVLSTMALSQARRRQVEREIIFHRRVCAHPNIVTIHDCLEDLSTLYIVMDACADGDLFKCITEDELYVGNDDMIKEVFSQLLDAVEFCHGKGVYHRDLKPENILCRNGGSRVLLTDFGLATQDKVSKDFRCGSEFYMSPECIGYASVDSYSTSHNDIWALGVILVNLVTCRNPWKRADLQDRGFGQFCLNSIGYMRTTLPISTEAISLLSRILKPAPTLRMSIPQMRKAILRVPTFLLTPSEAARAPEAAFVAAAGLFEIMTKRRPHLLLDHYEDICLHYPDVAERLCNKLRASMVDHRIINGMDELFSDRELVQEVPTELPEWAQPVTVDIRPEQLDSIADYPQSPDMSRDDSTATLATNGPITPATHPAQVEDNVPEVALDGVNQVEDGMNQLKVSNGSERLAMASSSSSIFGDALGPRIARVFGSAGNVFFR
ncbi:hypothetical protein FRC12_019364 [Ceratobasidium sp. 428]|nr:hypothetical protein FRC12_019364 [Ceratobasidium sp. 428]